MEVALDYDVPENEARMMLVDVARAMLNGTLDIIDGVRQICKLRHVIGAPDDPLFLPMRAVDSETDHFPLGKVRELYDVEYLKRLDDEMQRYLSDVRVRILLASDEIVRAYSRTSHGA